MAGYVAAFRLNTFLMSLIARNHGRLCCCLQTYYIPYVSSCQEPGTMAGYVAAFRLNTFLMSLLARNQEPCQVMLLPSD